MSNACDYWVPAYAGTTHHMRWPADQHQATDFTERCSAFQAAAMSRKFLRMV